ncbi:MAG TPA: hypothetical protein VGR29_02955 [Thermomicrobiales bacterium]|nr:hypothetical protein [Thermomicrobiales bacterium]
MSTPKRLVLALILVVLFLGQAGAPAHPDHASCQPLSDQIAKVAKAGAAGEFMRTLALNHQVAEIGAGFPVQFCEPKP